MPNYTVIGIYRDSGQTCADSVQDAQDGREALRRAAKMRLGCPEEKDAGEAQVDADGDTYELVVAIQVGGNAAENDGLTFPGNEIMETRDYLEAEDP